MKQPERVCIGAAIGVFMIVAVVIAVQASGSTSIEVVDGADETAQELVCEDGFKRIETSTTLPEYSDGLEEKVKKALEDLQKLHLEKKRATAKDMIRSCTIDIDALLRKLIEGDGSGGDVLNKLRQLKDNLEQAATDKEEELKNALEGEKQKLEEKDSELAQLIARKYGAGVASECISTFLNFCLTGNIAGENVLPPTVIIAQCMKVTADGSADPLKPDVEIDIGDKITITVE